MKPNVVSADVLFEEFRGLLKWEWVAGLGASERRFDEVAVRSARSGADLVGYAALCHDLGKALTPADELPRHLMHEQRGVAAVIALGDSSYDVFCGGGEQMRELLLELGVREVLPMLRLDASESVTPDEDAKPWLAELALALKA